LLIMNEEVLLLGTFLGTVAGIYVAVREPVGKMLQDEVDTINSQIYSTYDTRIKYEEELLANFKQYETTVEDFTQFCEEIRAFQWDYLVKKGKVFSVMARNEVAAAMQKVLDLQAAQLSSIKEQFIAGAEPAIRQSFAHTAKKTRDEGIERAIAALNAGKKDTSLFPPVREAFESYVKNFQPDWDLVTAAKDRQAVVFTSSEPKFLGPETEEQHEEEQALIASLKAKYPKPSNDEMLKLALQS